MLAIKELAQKYDLPEEALIPEFFDFLKVVSNGAKKYEMMQWLRVNGKTMQEKTCHDSMFHHLSESFIMAKHVNPVVDGESGLDPLLHLATRALMLYTRRQRGIIHPDDEVKV